MLISHQVVLISAREVLINARLITRFSNKNYRCSNNLTASSNIPANCSNKIMTEIKQPPDSFTKDRTTIYSTLSSILSKRQPPVPVTKQLHETWDEHQADDCCINGNRDRNTDTDLLHGHDIRKRECTGNNNHNERC